MIGCSKSTRVVEYEVTGMWVKTHEIQGKTVTDHGGGKCRRGRMGIRKEEPFFFV